MKKKRYLLGAVALTAALAATGCGGSGPRQRTAQRIRQTQVRNQAVRIPAARTPAARTPAIRTTAAPQRRTETFPVP